MSTEILIEDDRWTAAGLERLTQRALAGTLSHFGQTGAGAALSVLGCDDARIAALNADFRGKSSPTNVLSWPAAERSAPRRGAAPAPLDPEAELGDLAISYDTCAAEARAAGIAFDHHVLHLLVHGVLHLLGYDHEDDRDADLMEAAETAILATLGVPDPYGSQDQGTDCDGKD